MIFSGELIYLIVGAGASAIGAICGVGGGIVIKPLLDFMGTMDVTATSFISGCAVLAMSLSSVARAFARGDAVIDLRASTPLAVGAVIGGTLGQVAFQAMKASVADISSVEAAQSAALLLTTLASMIYTLRDGRIGTHRIKNVAVSALSGVVMGVAASFIGIGGGPINIMALSFLFSMKAKEAAINSLYVVMFSQASSIAHVLLKGAVPDFSALTLALMICGGVTGAMIGARISKKLTNDGVRRLYVVLMAVIVCGAAYNFYTSQVYTSRISPIR